MSLELVPMTPDPFRIKAVKYLRDEVTVETDISALRAEVARLEADLGQKDAVIDVCREIASMHLNTVTVEQIRLALAILARWSGGAIDPDAVRCGPRLAACGRTRVTRSPSIRNGPGSGKTRRFPARVPAVSNEGPSERSSSQPQYSRPASKSTTQRSVRRPVRVWMFR